LQNKIGKELQQEIHQQSLQVWKTKLVKRQEIHQQSLQVWETK
jgi:hypothetical protein